MISPVKGKKGGRSAFMRILILGDVVGEAGVRYVSSRLWSVRKSEKIDFAVVNAENCSDKNGIDEAGADMLLMSGADVLTTGNHAFRQRKFSSGTKISCAPQISAGKLQETDIL